MTDAEDRRRLQGRLELLTEVNRGGIGRVFAAFDPVIGRRVAVKMLRADIAEEERIPLRFAEEAQITGQLEHPNIVPIYDLAEDAEEPFIAMKLVRGKSLAEHLRELEQAPKPPAELQVYVEILLRLCDALSYAHSRGVIHCDLKPANVMVGDYGEVYLMDWGVAFLKSRHERGGPAPPFNAARLSNEDFDATERDSLVRVPGTHGEGSAIRGTVQYMAPEQLMGRVDEIDERTDVFGLGGILHEILTGLPPNEWGKVVDFKQDRRVLPTSSKLWSRLPPGLCQIATKALSAKREDRYGNIARMKAALEQFLHGGGWFDTRTFRAGEHIVDEGLAGDAAYIIERGHCDVFKQVQGEMRFVRRLGPGDAFGETAVLTGAARTATVIAIEEVTLKVITGESLNEELDRNPWLAAFVRSLAELFRETDARLSAPPE